jgi:HEAT repeat protein
VRRGLAASAALAFAVLATGCARPADDPVTARVAGLLADLERDDATVVKAAAALAALGPADAAAVPMLMAALSCPPEPTTGAADPHDDHHAHASHDHGAHDHGACNDHIVLAAAAALGAIGSVAVPPLVARLREGGEPDRTFAGYAMNRMTPAAAPALLAALDDPEPRVRLAVVSAIRGMQPPPADALAPFAGRLSDTDPEVRLQTADALGHFGAAAVPALLAAFDDPEPRVRATVASAFRAVGPPARAAIPALRAHLTDPAATVRLNSAAALAAVGAGDGESVAALAATLGDPEHIVRWGAAMALGRLGANAAGARPALERAAADTHPLVRAAATDALTHVPAPTP